MLKKIWSVLFGSKPKAEQPQASEVFPMLFNRAAREGQIKPIFIGEFDGVLSLPGGDPPALYSWIDRSNGNKLIMSSNRPLLQHWAVEELARCGVQMSESDPRVEAAIALFEKLALAAYIASVEQVGVP